MTSNQNQKTRKQLAPKGYSPNGCTAVPNFDFKLCCDEHDRQYSIPAGPLERFRADWKLMRCIQCKSKLFARFLIGVIYFTGVRIFGLLFFNYWFQARWHRIADLVPDHDGFYLVRWTACDSPFRVWVTRNVNHIGVEIGTPWYGLCWGFDEKDVKEPFSLGIESPGDILWMRDDESYARPAYAYKSYVLEKED